MAGICLTIDVGGSFIKYALIGPDRTLAEHGKIKTPTGSHQAYLDALEGIYRQFAGRVEGIAVSYPGIIDSDAGGGRPPADLPREGPPGPAGGGTHRP